MKNSEMLQAARESVKISKNWLKSIWISCIVLFISFLLMFIEEIEEELEELNE